MHNTSQPSPLLFWVVHFSIWSHLKAGSVLLKRHETTWRVFFSSIFLHKLPYFLSSVPYFINRSASLCRPRRVNAVAAMWWAVIPAKSSCSVSDVLYTCLAAQWVATASYKEMGITLKISMQKQRNLPNTEPQVKLLPLNRTGRLKCTTAMQEHRTHVV